MPRQLSFRAFSFATAFSLGMPPEITPGSGVAVEGREAKKLDILDRSLSMWLFCRT